MWLSICGLCALVLSLAGAFLYLDPQIPHAATYRNVQLATPLRVYAQGGELLAEYGERRLIPIALNEVPQQFINALLDTEDKRFYEHSGIDFISLTNDSMSLIGSLLTDGELGAGASTITMQLARNVSFSLERTFIRKFKEMLLALKIEQELTKDEILELYINIVPYGKRAYGAQAAALTYYGKPLSELNLPQLAMLAGIPQAPSAGNPINGPERALNRRNVVLARMYSQGSITQIDYEAAIDAPITAQLFSRELDVASPYASEWVRQQALALLPDLYTGGYKIFTTIDADLQTEAIKAVRAGLINYDQRHGYRGVEGRLEESIAQQIATISASLLPAIEENEPSESINDTPEDTAKDTPEETPKLSLDERVYPAELSDHVHEFLAESLVFGQLYPGVVLAVGQSKGKSVAIIQRGDRSFVPIRFEDSEWARPYVSVDRRGPLPEGFEEFLSPGDLVRIRSIGDAGENRWQLAQLPEVQGALVALDPNNGKVRSLVGGFDFYRNQYNHALQAARQPGSGFKPFVYSAALAAGVTPADIFMDAPLVFDDENLESQYRPDNDNNRYNGPTRLRQALYRSINLVSIRVLLKIGAGAIIEHAAKFGLPTATFPRNTQLAIGGGTMAVTPIDMARAYAVFANAGHLIDPNIVERIENSEGEVIFRANHPQVCTDCDDGDKQSADAGTDAGTNTFADLFRNKEEGATEAGGVAEMADTGVEVIGIEDTAIEQTDTDDKGIESPAESESETTADTNNPDELGEQEIPEIPPLIAAPRVIDERNAFIMHSMLQDVIRRGTGVRAKTLERGDLAGKTGTTNDAADTWFNGYNPNLVTTVWVGFGNYDPLGSRAYGSNTPLPIWVDYMRHALADTPEVFPTQPPGIVSVKIDPRTGERAAPGQSDAIFEYFLREYAPKETSTSNTPNPTNNQDEAVNAIDLF
jgi:penicillin-binding protein 1A